MLNLAGHLHISHETFWKRLHVLPKGVVTVKKWVSKCSHDIIELCVYQPLPLADMKRGKLSISGSIKQYRVIGELITGLN